MHARMHTLHAPLLCTPTPSGGGAGVHLCLASNSSIVLPEGNNLLLGLDVFEVPSSLAEVHTPNGLGGLIGVLRGAVVRYN